MRRRVSTDGPDPIDRYVGSRVKARRMGLRFSQTRLGKAIGVTFQQVQKYESGANRIGASNLYKISVVLGVDVGYFYHGMPDDLVTGVTEIAPGLAEEPEPYVHDPMLDRESIELMHNYFRIASGSVRRRLFQFVKSLADSSPPRDID